MPCRGRRARTGRPATDRSTDLHILNGEIPPTPYPIISGHGFARTVAGVDPDVRDLPEGTRVAVDPSLFCGRRPVPTEVTGRCRQRHHGTSG